MANKMLIDATHPEETRVVVLRGNRVEEFDFETAHRKQLRGNIYLAKVTRVEPSLQAAFVEYGGNRHGFLAFSEIHPDYYQIPIADRQALIEDDARAARESNGDDDHRGGRWRNRDRHRERAAARSDDLVQSEPLAAHEPHDSAEAATAEPVLDEPLPEIEPAAEAAAPVEDAPVEPAAPSGEAEISPATTPSDVAPSAGAPPFEAAPIASDAASGEPPFEPAPPAPEAGSAEPSFETALPGEVQSHAEGDAAVVAPAGDGNGHGEEEEDHIESVGGADALEEVPDRAPRYRRQYKIQEVIKRRQVMLVQVVKEERGTKGAALTTYLSLAGRYCVLMPNTARGGGISRKITSAEDRKKLREIAEDLEVPEGMGVILRTAGASRTKQEVKRDFEYLLRMWEQVRDLTLKSTAPTLVYEEGSLAKRSIRDLYSGDIDEIIVAGEQGYREAKDFMRMMMPSHAQNVKLYQDSQPIFTRYGIESQLDAMFSPTVQLRSGGYIVINQTEALVSIDVNSGRSTREHHIEDTALKTNVEAAEEIARQLRLRDLAGLIVIDFIDMDEKRNNRTVERRLKDALRHDRARIQVGRISHFGLLEMSRQRIRSSVLESSTEKCAHCGGTGHVRSVSSVSLQLLRAIEETLLKGPTHNLLVRTRPEIALYVLNHKRAHLRELEERFRVALTVNADENVGGQTAFVIDRGEQVMTLEQAKTLLAEQAESAPLPLVEEEPEAFDDFEAAEATAEAERGTTEVHAGGHGDEIAAPGDAAHDGDGGHEAGARRRRRRRRGRGGRSRGGDGPLHQPPFEPGAYEAHEAAGDPRSFGPPDTELASPAEFPPEPSFASAHAEDGEQHHDGNGEQRKRRRGRRGGRRNRRDRERERGQNDFTAVQGAEIHERPDYSERPEWSPPPEAHVALRVEAAPVQEPAPRPAPAPAAAAAAAPAAPEPVRRRSTVREPAPVFSGGDGAPVVTPMPAPAPPTEPAPVVVSSTESADENKPRRTGWWAKRLLGGNKG